MGKPIKKVKTVKAVPNNAKKRFCIQSRCKAEGVNQGYCRKHYIMNWRTIKFAKQVKAERRLNNYVAQLAKKYPGNFLEKIKEGLEDEGKFKETMAEIEMESDGTISESEREYMEKFVRGLKIGNE